MSVAARDAFVLAVLAATATPEHYLSAGRPHRRAKGQALDELTLHFSRGGRVLYLADEMAVLYPSEEVFTPDILAVESIPQPEEDTRMAWVMQDEGRGLDFVLEILHRGDRAKDLRRNVERYARLGIREYFVYDRANYKVLGFALGSPGARVYRELKPRLGRLRSTVLDLDLAVVERRLRFFSGFAEIIGSAELIDRLGSMMEQVEARAETEAQRAEALEAALQEREQRLCGTLRETVLALLAARGLPAPAPVAAEIAACADEARLRSLLLRAAVISDPADLLRGGSSE